MTIAFRDSTVVIIEIGRTLVRAGLGLHDLLKTPAITIPARVGLRRSEATAVNGNTGEGVPVASTSRVSMLPQYSNPSAKVNEYLVGPQLDEALAAGQDILVSWPFANGDVSDWIQAEAIWKYVLFTRLGLRRLQNESPVILSIPSGLPRDTYERICQVFFERFNVAGFAIVDRPIAQLYAANVLTGVVVDIGYEHTDITPIYEGIAAHPYRTETTLGIYDCQHYLAHLLRSNQSVMSVFSPADSPLEPAALQKKLVDVAQRIWEEGLVKVPVSGEAMPIPEDEGVTDIAAVLVAGKEKAVIESGIKKKLSAKASAAEQARAKEIEAMDLVTLEFGDQSVTVGKERHRFCEPLFDPALLEGIPGLTDRASLKSLSVQDALGYAIGQMDVDQRQYVWQGLFVTGELTNYVKGIGVALQSRLAPFILSSPDQQNELQPRNVRVLNVPEYFAEYREKGDGLAAFLGTSIVGKLAFNDAFGKNFVSKADYTEKGPHAIIEMSPSLL